MSEVKMLQRIVRLVARNGFTYVVDEVCPGHKPTSKVNKITPASGEGAYQVNLEIRKEIIGDRDTVQDVRQFIIVFKPILIDIDEIDPPLIQPANVLDMPNAKAPK